MATCLNSIGRRDGRGDVQVFTRIGHQARGEFNAHNLGNFIQAKFVAVVSVAEIAESEGCHSGEGIVIQSHNSIGLPLKIVHFVSTRLGHTASPDDSNDLLRGCRATGSAAKGKS